MKAAVMEAFGEPLVIRDVADPKAPDDGVVIRVGANGICRTDWHYWQGHWSLSLPHVLGHELTGVIETVGPRVGTWKPGQRVIVPAVLGCSACPSCRSGFSNLCDNEFTPGFTAWGGYAERVAVPYADANLVALPEELGFAEAASLGCRFMTSFRAVIFRGRVRPGEWVAVYGCGGIGLSAVMIAAAAGATVVAVDIDRRNLDMARSVGAAFTVDATEPDHPAEVVRSITGGGADVSFDAVGHPETCRNAVRSLKKRGRHVQIGLLGEDNGEMLLPVDLIVAKELEFLGSLTMPVQDYPVLLDMVTAGRLKPAKLITDTISLEDAGATLAAMDTFDTVGVIVIDRF